MGSYNQIFSTVGLNFDPIILKHPVYFIFFFCLLILIEHLLLIILYMKSTIIFYIICYHKKWAYWIYSNGYFFYSLSLCRVSNWKTQVIIAIWYVIVKKWSLPYFVILCIFSALNFVQCFFVVIKWHHHQLFQLNESKR